MGDGATTWVPSAPAPRSRSRRAVAALAAAAASVLAFGGAVAMVAPASGAESGVTIVDVPYLSEIEVSPSEGWTIADCAAVAAPVGIELACDPTKLTFRAPVYDADLERQDVPVTLTTGSTTLAVVYRVGLAPPEPPVAESRDHPTPAAQGSRLLVPLSDLAIACTLCVEGGGPRLEAVGVSPRRAGTLGFTSTHLVFAAAPDFTGDAELTYRVVDDLGQESEPATLTVSLYPTGSSSLIALHAVVEAERDGTTAIDLAALVATSGEDEPVITACGAAVRGAAVCPGDGTAEFRSTDAPVDQFSFTVVTKDGEQATGSVTVVAAGLASAPLPGPVGAGGRAEEATIVPARVPVEEQREGDVSPFDPLVGLLDRVSG